MMWYMRYPNFKTKAVTFSYDDGVVQDRKLAGIFDKYGMKGTFNINGAFLGNPRYRSKYNSSFDRFILLL